MRVRRAREAEQKSDGLFARAPRAGRLSAAHAAPSRPRARAYGGRRRALGHFAGAAAWRGARARARAVAAIGARAVRQPR